MASSSSNPSSTSSSSSNPSSTSSSSSTTSTPSDPETVWPPLPTRAAAPAASAAPGVVPGANATASASAPGVSRSIQRPTTMTFIPTGWGGTKGVPLPRYCNCANQWRRGGPPRNSVVVSQPSRERGRQSAADRTSTFAPSRLSIEGSSPSTSAWSKPLPWLSNEASTSTVTTPASASEPDTFAASTSSAPGVTTSVDLALEPDKIVASTTPTAPGVPKIVDAALEPDATTSTTPSAPGVPKIVDAALEPDATTSTTPSAPGVPKIVDAALEPEASASTPSSAPGVTTIADPSATTSAPGAAPTIPSLRNHWLAIRWGIVPRPVELEPCPGQQAFGGNGMPPVEALYPADPLCPWREQVPAPRSFGAPLCWACCDRPARLEARPCGHLAICVRCYCDAYGNNDRFPCPYCSSPITWQLCW